MKSEDLVRDTRVKQIWEGVVSDPDGAIINAIEYGKISFDGWLMNVEFEETWDGVELHFSDPRKDIPAFKISWGWADLSDQIMAAIKQFPRDTH